MARRVAAIAGMTAAAALVVTGCSSGGGDAGGDGGGDDPVRVSLITKTDTNPFFVFMAQGAEAAAEELGVELTLAAGREDGDEDTQIQAVENAVSRGDQGILIAPNGPAVEDSLIQARDAGVFVIGLDTPPADPEAVDITFATDNRKAGQLIGQWTSAALDGEKAVIAMVDLHDDKHVSVDINRDQGFLEGMGIDVADGNVIGDEEKTGEYTGGAGGEYEIVGHQASKGAEAEGRTAAEMLLAQSDDINVLYAINEPAAYGAFEAFQAAGYTGDDVLVAAVDGGCAGVQAIQDGIIDATSQQYPMDMAQLGVEAIHKLVTTGEEPEPTEGLDFFDTGVSLITDEAQDGVESIDSAEGLELCWG